MEKRKGFPCEVRYWSGLGARKGRGGDAGDSLEGAASIREVGLEEDGSIIFGGGGLCL